MYQRSEAGFGSIGGVAALSLDRALPPIFGRAAPAAPRCASPFDDIDFVPDLGANIGSATWWRGLATCGALLALSYALSPGLRPLPGLVPATPVGETYEEARALSIAPLAFGGDTGRRMAATDAVQPLLDTPERPSIDLAVSVGSGDGLARALERAGVGAAEASRVANLAAAVAPPDGLAPGTALALTLGRRANRNVARPLDALAFRARFDMRVAFRRENGVLTMQQTPIAIDRTPLRVTGSVGDSVFLSATRAGAPSKAVQAYIRALSGKASLDRLSDGAQFDLIVERDRAETGEVRFGKLLYVGLTQGGRTTRMIEWTIGGRSEWYDAAGVGRQRSGFTTPVAGARKTSGFGWRIHPLLGYSRMHQGTDYGAAHGTPIRAVTDGVVGYAGYHGGHGKMVKLRHAGGLGSGYAHMSKIAVSPGMRVTQGQVIGFVGSTGLSTGPHLHFEVYRGGAAVNPKSVNFETTSLLSGAELTAFRTKLAKITAL